MKRAQAAMEFLSTYGWMLFILLIVFSVLVYMGLLNPSHPPLCSFPSNLVCKSFKLTTDGNLTLDLFQNTGHDITVTGINCTANNNAASNPTFIAINVPIHNADHQLIANGTNVRCLDINGNNVTGSTGSFTGKLIISYVENDTSMPHNMVGDLTAAYE